MMKLRFLALPLLLALTLPAHALDLKGVLKDAMGQNDSKQQSSNDAATAVSGINWSNPSNEEEVELGREIAGNLLGAAPLVKDAALQQYVNRVGRWLASQSERADLPWRFGVIEDSSINAFAAPGGYILLTRGLYQKLENEAQLAGVLAHEIGHVVKKHHLKVIQKQQLLNAGANLLSDKVARGKRGIDQVIGNGAEIMARGLDKSAEYEADRDGVTLATRAGYDPYGLPEVLQMLSAINPGADVLTLLYKTHPHPDERLVKLDDAIGNRLDKITSGKTLPERFYRLP